MPYLVIGTFIIFVGVWLLRTPRYSKIGIFLGSMWVYRVFGVILILFGSLAVLAGLGVEYIGPYPVKVN